MPIELSPVKTKSGYQVLRANFIQEVTVAEVTGYHDSLLPGARYEGWGHLIVGNVLGVTAEVRRVLSSRKAPDPPPPVAVVLDSALARMTAALALRLAENANSDWFKNEVLAMEWLDGRMAEFIARLAQIS